MKPSMLSIAAALGSTATLAHAQPDTWALLGQIEIEEIVTEETYEVRKSYPRGLFDTTREVQITGYAAPMLPGDLVKELILVSDMGTCPFCGSADHGASLQVSLADPIEMTGDETQRITLRGTLAPVSDPQTWQAVVMRNARVIADR